MKNITTAQKEHFGKLYREFTGTTMAVSSESQAHKLTRYTELCHLFEGDRNFSVHDVGMGLSDYYKHLLQHHDHLSIEYSGSEILPEYVAASQDMFPDNVYYLRDLSEGTVADRYDYLIMSGVFHQRRDTTIPDWEKYAQSLIANVFQMCRKGIGFNFVSPFVDFYQKEVYYCNLHKLLEFIAGRLSRHFEIRHSSALFEFTVFVYQPSFIQAKYEQPEFQKYFRRQE